MLPGVKDLKIYQNSDFVYPFTVKEENNAIKDLTGYTSKMQIRDRNNSELLLELTTENTGIAITIATGTVTITITSTDTADLQNGVYDLFLINEGKKYPYLSGNVTVIPSVTR